MGQFRAALRPLQISGDLPPPSNGGWSRVVGASISGGNGTGAQRAKIPQLADAAWPYPGPIFRWFRNAHRQPKMGRLPHDRQQQSLVHDLTR